jgi:hypothetical protein
VYNHSNPQRWQTIWSSGDSFQRAPDLESVPLTQSQISRAVEKAIGAATQLPEIEPSTVGSSEEIITTTEETESAPEPDTTTEPEVSAAESEENYEPEPVQASAEPDNSQEATEPPSAEAAASEVLERATAYAQRLAGNLWEGIRAYKLPDDEGLRERRTALFVELMGIVEHAGSLFADAHVIKMQAFAEEHEAVRLQCRACLDRIEELERERAPLDSRLRQCQQASSQARELLTTETESKPRRYPSAKEIKAWEKRVEKAREAVDLAQADEAEANSARNELIRESRRHAGLFDGRDGKPGLKQKELDLRAAKDGKPHRDFETGFIVPAEF